MATREGNTPEAAAVRIGGGGAVLAAVLAGLVLLAPLAALAQTQFDPAQILRWRPHSFKGQTDYRLAAIGGRPAIRATCTNGASGLFREQRIDLRATPVVEWSWRADSFPAAGAGERARAGDDFAARLYVVVDGGLMRWRTRAVNYVWARSAPVGSSWPNPFASQARMVAVRSGPAPAPGRLYTQRRNIREDFKRFHGLDVEAIDAVAIMTDCDNTGAAAQAWYGSIRFLPAAAR